MGAVITRTRQAPAIAASAAFPGTTVALSGQDSWKVTSSPADCALQAAAMFWDWGDGAVGFGFRASHVYSTPGTYLPVLTIRWKDGTTSSVAYSLVVLAAPTFPEFKKFVNYATGDDANDGHDDAHAYKTFERAAAAWNSYRGAGTSVKPVGVIAVRGGQPFTYDKLNSTDGFGNPHDATISFGPLLVTTYGAGGRAEFVATATASSGDGFRLAEGGHDHPFEEFPGDPYFNPNAYNNFVLWDGIDFTFTKRNQDVGTWNTIGFDHVAVELRNSNLVKAGLGISAGGGGPPHGACVFNVTSDQAWRNGIFWSCGESTLDTVTVSGAGSLPDRDCGLYSSAGIDHCSARNVTLIHGSPGLPVYGFKTTGANKLWVENLETHEVRTAFDVGGNNDPPENHEETHDLVVDGMKAYGTTDVGLWPDYLRRVSFRNVQVFGGCSFAAVIIGSYNATQYIDGFEVLNSTFSQVLGAGVFFGRGLAGVDDTWSRNLRFQDCVFTKPFGAQGVDHNFYEAGSGTALANTTLGGNHYFRDGDDLDSGHFATTPGGEISFRTWRDSFATDPGAEFSDPLFVDELGLDLSLASGSPCVDTGIDTGIALDAVRRARPQGPAYDKGALEADESGDGFFGSGELGAAGATLAAAGEERFEGGGELGATTPTLEGEGSGGFVGTGEFTAPGIELDARGGTPFSGGGGAGVLASPPVLDGSGELSFLGSAPDLPAPVPEIEGDGGFPFSGGATSLLAPCATLEGFGGLPIFGSGEFLAPCATLAGHGDAKLVEPPVDPGAPIVGEDLVERVATALADLFPPGLLYKPVASGHLYQVRLALADEAAELRARARYLLDVELDPRRTLELLPDWERWYGLPDPALASLGPQTVAQRRAALLAKIRATGGQSPDYFVTVAATIGFTIEIEEFDRTKVGDKVGSPILVGDWEFVWKVHAPRSTIRHARAGASFAGDRIGEWGNAPLEALLAELKPAHTVLLFAYDLD
jgi:uncharacterized protein YmfQ (DUF2313 family)